MIITKKLESTQLAQLIETKYGYIINGLYHKKDMTPIPFKFIDIQGNKNVFGVNSVFPIIRHAGDNVYSNEINLMIQDNLNPNITYIFTPSMGYIDSPNLYSGPSNEILLYKIYETEDEFEILKKVSLGVSYATTHEGPFKYLTQDELYIYGFRVQNLSYNGTIGVYKISKSDLTMTAAFNNTFTEILYEDNDIVISFSNPNTIAEVYSYKFEKNSLTDMGYCTTIKDPEDNNQYTFKNDGTGDDPLKNNSNNKTIHNLFTNTSTRSDIKKFNGIFNAKDSTNLEIYRPIIGIDGILDDGKVNIVKFNIDIDACKTASKGSMPAHKVRTCTISNKSEDIFTKWRDKMYQLNNNYFTCKSMKFEKDDNTYLVIDTYISASLSGLYTQPDASYTNSNISVFKINKDDHSILEMKSEYVEPDSAHKGLIPINDEMFLLSTNTGWSILTFDYTEGKFKKLKKISKGTGWLGFTDDQRLMFHTTSGDLDMTKIIGIPYKPTLRPENENVKYSEGMETNIILETKDFLGNNIDAIATCYIIGDGVVFKDNSSKEIQITMTKSDDKKVIPIKVTQRVSSVEFTVSVKPKE